MDHCEETMMIMMDPFFEEDHCGYDKKEDGKYGVCCDCGYYGDDNIWTKSVRKEILMPFIVIIGGK